MLCSDEQCVKATFKCIDCSANFICAQVVPSSLQATLGKVFHPHPYKALSGTFPDLHVSLRRVRLARVRANPSVTPDFLWTGCATIASASARNMMLLHTKGPVSNCKPAGCNVYADARASKASLRQRVAIQSAVYRLYNGESGFTGPPAFGFQSWC